MQIPLLFNKIGRRKFVKVMAAGSIGGVLFSPFKNLQAKYQNAEKPATNIADALKHSRNALSMPGKFPSEVVKIISDKAYAEKQIDQKTVEQMLEKGMLELTGKQDISEAWKLFVSEKDRIGLKVNPVAGPQLSTSHEIVKAVISQLERAGIPRENLVIWDRREFELNEVGFTEENYPGLKVTGTERKDPKGSFYDANGKLYSEEMIDKNWYYWADCQEKYDAETLPYMINEGQYSYFSKIVTQQVDKIINIPILKNAGVSVTLALKNLAYGAISNTSRLHKQLWSDTCAEVCAFPPLRDKVVLNIVDGIIGCYQGGPSANPQFITNFNTLLLGSDPVAVDRIGYEIILKKRIAENIQKADIPKAKSFLEMAEKLELGTADLNKIRLKEITI